MGGKSSYVRMIALCNLMGQIGSPIPATQAFFTPYDNIYTRMGAAEDLAAGMSTFMVEMYRTSRILKKATPNSLVILDELGRGTSSTDGSAIARATLKYFVEHIGCSMLFITHFTEVSKMVNTFEILKNKCVNVHMSYIENEVAATEVAEGTLGKRKRCNNITFLYKVTEGTASSSYGLNVL